MRTRHAKYSEGALPEEGDASDHEGSVANDSSDDGNVSEHEDGQKEPDTSDNGEESNNGNSSDDSSDSDSSSDDEEDEEETDQKEVVSQAEMLHAISLASEAAAKTFGWDRPSPSTNSAVQRKRKSATKGGEGNALSELIPGYTAPMKLEVQYAPSANVSSRSELRRRAQQTDASTAHCVFGCESQLDRSSSMQKRHANTSSSGASSFKLGSKRMSDGTAGSGWFGMVPAELTDEVKTDIAVIRNRTYLDPKRFYKKADIINPKMVQVGTVIEGNAEYYSSRLTKKQRRQNVTEEIMADVDVAKYAKKQFAKVQTSRQGRFEQGYGRKKKRGGGPGSRKRR